MPARSNGEQIPQPVARILWAQNEPPIAVNSLEELDRHIDSIVSRDSSKLPTIVEVIIRGRVLTLGLGQAEGFVQLQSEDGLPPYLVTLGDPCADGGVTFYYLGFHHTGIPRKHLIDASMARAIVAEFFETGERLENIEWEEI